MITCSEVQNIYHTLSDSVKQIYFFQIFVVSPIQFLPNTSWVFHIYLEKERTYRNLVKNLVLKGNSFPFRTPSPLPSDFVCFKSQVGFLGCNFILCQLFLSLNTC